MPDEAGIDRGIEPPILSRDIPHPLAVRNVDEVHRRRGDKILRSGLGANVTAQMRQQPVCLRLIEPNAVGHCRVDVDYHDMPP